jgi:uncharacterized membrane protein YfcA
MAGGSAMASLGFGSLAIPIALGIAALVTAALSAILGMGGGITLLGVMTIVLAARDVVPLHGVVQMCSNLTRTIAFLEHVKWRLFGVYAPASVAGILMARAVWSDEQMGWFKPAIGVFILAFLVWRRRSTKLRNLPMYAYLPVGVGVGFLTIFVGATGPFLAPFMLRDDFEKENVIATKAACQMWLHLLKIPAFLSLGFDYRPHLPLLAVLVVAVIIGTYAGKALLTRMSSTWFNILFQGLLCVIAIYLIARPLFG